MYVGITSNLTRRVYEHKNKMVEGFTADYGLDKLIHYEVFDHPQDAIIREKQLKKWNRKWKLELIERQNPKWEDLYSTLI